MNCLECQELLQKRLNGERVGASAALDQHLSQCATCREQHASAVLLLEGLQQLPKPKLAPGFAQSLAVRVLLDRRQRQQKVRRRLFVTMALAASVLFMLFAAYYWIPRTGPEQPGPKGPFVEKLPKKESPPFKAPEPKQVQRD